MSIPGQTMGMAVFTDHFIEVFGLSRTQLSIAYLLGTLGSSIFLTRAGRFYDRAGARISIVGASFGLGLCLVYIAAIDQITKILLDFFSVSIASVTFPLILAGYFGVRFSGQGVLTSASRNVLLVWFEKRRGLVSGARSVFVTFGFSLAPPFLAFLIAVFGWRTALLVLAIMVGAGFTLFALVLIRNPSRRCSDVPAKSTSHIAASKSPKARTLLPLAWAGMCCEDRIGRPRRMSGCPAMTERSQMG